MTHANTEVKTYTNKSNAQRAIKAAGEYAAAVSNQFITTVQNGFVVDLNEVSEYEKNARANYAAQEAQRALELAKPVKVAKAKPAKVAKVYTEKSHESTIVRPCKQVWHIADSMKGSSRKEVIAACEAAGIAFFTARTQYQSWKACENEMAARTAIK